MQLAKCRIFFTGTGEAQWAIPSYTQEKKRFFPNIFPIYLCYPGMIRHLKMLCWTVLVATNDITNIFWLDFNRKPCKHQPQSITFRLLCLTAEQAEELAQQMRCKPEDFSSFRLHFHLTSIMKPSERGTI